MCYHFYQAKENNQVPAGSLSTHFAAHIMVTLKIAGGEAALKYLIKAGAIIVSTVDIQQVLFLDVILVLKHVGCLNG